MKPFIDLEKVKNVRDISYLKTKEGKDILPFKLIRSAELAEATENDLKALYEKYDVRLVIDLRSDVETSERPDRLYKDMRYVNIHLLDFDEPSVVQRDSKMQETLARFNEDVEFVPELARDKMATIYKANAVVSHSQQMFKKILDLMLENKDHATLWHCAMGKDRCGCVAMVVENLLQIAEEDIHADYLLTNEAFYPGQSPTHCSRDFFFFAFDYYYDSFVNAINDEFDGFDNWLEKAVGFSKQEQETFRRAFIK